MDYLDYRERLGVGYKDEQKFMYFKAKIFNVLNAVNNDDYSGCIDMEEYYSFCNTTGTSMELRLADSCYSADRFRHCLNVLDHHSSYLAEFLPYYMALTNSVKAEKYGNWKRKDFVCILEKMLNESHIPYEVLERDGEFFVFPKGVEEFDSALVSEPLQWLCSYPATENAWCKALREYAENDPQKASDVADKFRKTLETFFQEFFGNNKSLENNKPEYGRYLKNQGVPSEISNDLERLLVAYTSFMNSYAKHHDKTENRVLEYLMYQTGNIIRLLITIKKLEPTEQQE